MVREWCWAVSAIFSIHRPSRIWVSWAAKRMDIQTVSHPKEHLMPWTIQSDIEIFVFFFYCRTESWYSGVSRWTFVPFIQPEEHRQHSAIHCSTASTATPYVLQRCYQENTLHQRGQWVFVVFESDNFVRLSSSSPTQRGLNVAHDLQLFCAVVEWHCGIRIVIISIADGLFVQILLHMSIYNRNFIENFHFHFNNKNIFVSLPGDTLGMEGNVYERRPSTSQQNWFEHKQQSYSNIFVTPPGTESDRVRLEKMTDAEREGSYGKIVIKDRHECEFEFYYYY